MKRNLKIEKFVIVHPERKNMGKPQNCKRSAVPQMRERGLRSVLVAHEQADDKADVVLLNGYRNFSTYCTDM